MQMTNFSHLTVKVLGGTSDNGASDTAKEMPKNAKYVCALFFLITILKNIANKQ